MLPSSLQRLHPFLLSFSWLVFANCEDECVGSTTDMAPWQKGTLQRSWCQCGQSKVLHSLLGYSAYELGVAAAAYRDFAVSISSAGFWNNGDEIVDSTRLRHGDRNKHFNRLDLTVRDQKFLDCLLSSLVREWYFSNSRKCLSSSRFLEPRT